MGEIPVVGGVAAFDPVTLKIAAEGLRSTGVEVLIPPSVDRPVGRVFEGLSEIELGPSYVTATIDTGLLRWSSDPDRSENESYAGRAIRSVTHFGQECAQLDDALLTCFPMQLGPGLDELVTAWCAEVRGVRDSWDPLALQARAEKWMSAWAGAQRRLYDEVSIPALDVTYRAENDLVVGLDCEQRFALGLDETGARAIAETTICTGVPAFTAPPEIAHFGERGPVIYWFSSYDRQVPFCIAYTDDAAWSDPEDEPELLEVRLDF